ncbi:hypothetical protein DY000_02054590 [Brassica cretica]|uniref:Uncharacterized protein n=1 Tax=Brassica cretica TaxID=69181 RepID=A0ABQ7ACR4_BRACR|nr:hypothetical protein DY000_02054590 [Brassica cretica]
MEWMLQLSTCQVFGTDCKDLVSMIQDPGAWLNFSTELGKILGHESCRSPLLLALSPPYILYLGRFAPFPGPDSSRDGLFHFSSPFMIIFGKLTFIFSCKIKNRPAYQPWAQFCSKIRDETWVLRPRARGLCYGNLAEDARFRDRRSFLAYGRGDLGAGRPRPGARSYARFTEEWSFCLARGSCRGDEGLSIDVAALLSIDSDARIWAEHIL